MKKKSFCTQKTCLGCISSNGNSLHLTSAQRALGSTLANLPQIQERTKREKGKGCFPKQTHWAWFSFTEFNTHCKGKASILLFCAFCEIAILPLLSHLALSSFFPACEKKHFHATSVFSTKENMFGVPFKQCKLPAPNQCTESIGQHIGSLALGIGEDQVGKRQGLCSQGNLHW